MIRFNNEEINSDEYWESFLKLSEIKDSLESEYLLILYDRKTNAYNSSVDNIYLKLGLPVISIRKAYFKYRLKEQKEQKRIKNRDLITLQTPIETILYYIRVGSVYKIGITKRSVKERYSKTDYENIVIVKEWIYLNRLEAQQQELNILNEFKYAKYTGDAVLENGNSELFDRDILLLDMN